MQVKLGCAACGMGQIDSSILTGNPDVDYQILQSAGIINTGQGSEVVPVAPATPATSSSSSMGLLVIAATVVILVMAQK